MGATTRPSPPLPKCIPPPCASSCTRPSALAGRFKRKGGSHYLFFEIMNSLAVMWVYSFSIKIIYYSHLILIAYCLPGHLSPRTAVAHRRPHPRRRHAATVAVVWAVGHREPMVRVVAPGDGSSPRRRVGRRIPVPSRRRPTPAPPLGNGDAEGRRIEVRARDTVDRRAERKVESQRPVLDIPESPLVQEVLHDRYEVVRREAIQGRGIGQLAALEHFLQHLGERSLRSGEHLGRSASRGGGKEEG